MRREILSTHAAFASFGAFWGAWAALLPAVQRHVGASKSQLGLALLCVAVGALPAMLATGAILDRLRRGVVGPALLLFAASIVPASPRLSAGSRSRSPASASRPAFSTWRSTPRSRPSRRRRDGG